MPRLCTAHGLLYPKGSRCPECAREKDRERGSRRARGIGKRHEEFARMIKREKLPCAECGQPFGDPNNPITVGHIVARTNCLAIGKDPDDPSNLRPECKRCNLRKGAR